MFFEKRKSINSSLKPTKEQKSVLKSLKKGDIVLAKKQFSKKNFKELSSSERN